MVNLKCTVLCSVFLLAHLDIALAQSLPGISFNISRCRYLHDDCYKPTKLSPCQNDQDCEALHPGKGLKCCWLLCHGKRCRPNPVVLVAKMTPVKLLKRLKKTPTRLVAKCPTSPPSRGTPPGPYQECQNDAVCDAKFPGQGLKCCSDGLDFRCIPPVVESVSIPVKAYCPLPAPEQPGECRTKYAVNGGGFCANEADCRENNPTLKSFVKCCDGKCRDLTCTIAEVKMLPTIPYSAKGKCPILLPTPESCRPFHDDQCHDDQTCIDLFSGNDAKCCRVGCDLKCLPVEKAPHTGAPIKGTDMPKLSELS